MRFKKERRLSGGEEGPWRSLSRNISLTVAISAPPPAGTRCVKWLSPCGLPVRCVAQGEGSGQEAQVQDGLCEVQHPGIGAHQVKLENKETHRDRGLRLAPKHPASSRNGFVIFKHACSYAP